MSKRKLAVTRARQTQNGIQKALHRFFGDDDFEVLEWEVVPQSKHALIVVEYEEAIS